MKKTAGMPLVLVLIVACRALAAPSQTATGIAAHWARGQTFVTWDEIAADDRGLTYCVYRSEAGPITDVSRARLVGKVGPDSSMNAGVNGFARRDKKPLSCYRIPPDTELGPKQGLLVWTALRDAGAYYAVTVADRSGENKSMAPGANSLRAPVRERVAAPEPVFQGIRPFGKDRTHWYVYWPNWQDTPLVPAMGPRPGLAFNFMIRNPDAEKPGSLLVSLPGIGGGWSSVFRELAPDDVSLHFYENTHRVGYYFGEHDRRKEIRNPDKYPDDSVIRNHNQRYILHVVRWVLRRYALDPNRVYLGGVSMGGIGTANLGFAFPHVFAAMYVHIPRLDIGDPMWIRESKEVVVLKNNIFKRAWGPFDKNFPTSAIGEKYPEFRAISEGMRVFDRTNQVLIAEKSVNVDFPVCLVGCGKRDWTVGWTDKPRFIKAMEKSRHQMFFYWMTGGGDRGHNARFHKTLWPENGYDPQRLKRYALDQSYPAINNLAINDDPGEGMDMVPPEFKVTGDDLGTINGYVDWEPESIVDTAKEWRVFLRIVDVVDRFEDTRGVQETTADVTPRRLQEFRVEPGRRYSWKVVDADTDAVIVPGRTAAADEHGLVTMKGVKIRRTGSTVVLTR